jgi:uncharacterized membrane protein
VTFAVAIAALVLAARHWPAENQKEYRIAVAVLIVSINLLALLALNREITDAFSGIVRDFGYSALWLIYGAGLMAAGFWKKSQFIRWQALILIAVTVGKVFLYDTSSLDRGYRILILICLGLVLMATSFLYQRKRLKLERSPR